MTRELRTGEKILLADIATACGAAAIAAEIKADEYQGWTNRETWTANLWIGNDERLYNHARSIAQGAGSIFEKQDMLQASWARVNWREILDCLSEA